MKHYCVVWWLIVLNVCVAGIDGLVDMKHIYGIIVVRRKGRRGKEDKVSERNLGSHGIITLCLVF